MAPKPFGKPARRMPLFLTGALLFLAAGPVLYLALFPLARFRRTVDSDAFFWPSAAVFGLLLMVAARLWMKWRRKPEGPEGPPGIVRLYRLILPLLIAAPLALACAFLYRPALTLLNGCSASGSPRVAHAMVELHEGAPVLRSPYWPLDSYVALNSSDGVERVTPGTFARLTLARGLLGALWVRQVEFEELP